MKVGDEYADGCFDHLQVFLRIIDVELSKVFIRISNTTDADTEGLCDLGEYLSGYGFVAIQRYITSPYLQAGQNKKNTYKIGAKLNNDLYLIEAINAGANYWKHEPEWPFVVDTDSSNKNGMAAISINRSGNHLTDFQKKTFDVISKITPYADYTLSNLLAKIIEEIAPESETSFSPILPFIKQWRNALNLLPITNTGHQI